jgi:hypothetical protein
MGRFLLCLCAGALMVAAMGCANSSGSMVPPMPGQPARSGGSGY